jgi:hypothetical protein
VISEKKCLPAMPPIILAKLWTHVLIAELNKICYLVQICTIFLLEAQMV